MIVGTLPWENKDCRIIDKGDKGTDMCLIFPLKWGENIQKEGDISVYLLSIKIITILFSLSYREAKLKDYYIVYLVNIFSNFIALKVHII